jgi:hypothetical protein
LQEEEIVLTRLIIKEEKKNSDILLKRWRFV